MIVYQPAFDPYHCTFRIISILEKLDDANEIEVDKIKIYDFLLLFPSYISSMQLPAGNTEIRKKLKVNDYNSIKSPRRIFFQLDKIQMIALNSLASTDVIDHKLLKEGFVKRTDKGLNEQVLNLLASQSPRKMIVLNFIREVLREMNSKELKKRSGLTEYRYDLV